MMLFPNEHEGSASFQTTYVGHTGKRRRVHLTSLNWRPSVKRALPYPASEKRCKWRATKTARGRKLWIPIR